MRLPLTITVTEHGVTVEHPEGLDAMSRYGGRAQRLAQSFGVGVHTVTTEQEWNDIPEHDQADLIGA